MATPFICPRLYQLVLVTSSCTLDNMPPSKQLPKATNYETVKSVLTSLGFEKEVALLGGYSFLYPRKAEGSLKKSVDAYWACQGEEDEITPGDDIVSAVYELYLESEPDEEGFRVLFLEGK